MIMEYKLDSILLTLEKILKEVTPDKNLKGGFPECGYDYTEKFAAYCEIVKESIAEKDCYVSNILKKALESRITRFSDDTVPFLSLIHI